MWSRYTDSDRAHVLDRLDAAGVSWVRLDVNWSTIEDLRKGARNSSAVELLDRCVDIIRARGFKVLATLWATPDWSGGGASTAPPARASDYGDFARWVAARLRGRVTAWQLWNEPNNTMFWTGTVAGYVDVLRAGYTGVKAGDPGALVVFGGTSFNDAAWIREAYAHGAKGSFDALATHPYQGRGDEPPERADDGSKWWFTHTPAVRQVMVDYGDAATPLWFTEFGWSAHANNTIPTGSDYNWARGVTEAVQADYAVRAINYARSNWSYVGPMFWYKDRSWSGVQTANPAWLDLHLEGYGLLRSDSSARPVYHALKKLLTGS